MAYGKPFKMPSAYDPTPPCEYVTEVRLNEEREKEGGVMGDRKAKPVLTFEFAVLPVRCRVCKYRTDRGRRHYCDAHGGGFFEVAPDDYCSWGERREARK